MSRSKEKKRYRATPGDAAAAVVAATTHVAATLAEVNAAVVDHALAVQAVTIAQERLDTANDAHTDAVAAHTAAVAAAPHDLSGYNNGNADPTRHPVNFADYYPDHDGGVPVVQCPICGKWRAGTALEPEWEHRGGGDANAPCFDAELP